MKANLARVIIVLIGCGIIDFAYGQSTTNPPVPMFSVYPEIANADPSLCHAISVRIPSRLKIKRSSDELFVQVDPDSAQPTNIMVGTNMITGVQSQWFVYAAGDQKPVNDRGGLTGGLDFNLGGFYWHTKPDNIPLPGKKYWVEIDMEIFETDIPAQHMWSPTGGKYRVLWRGVLKQMVQ